MPLAPRKPCKIAGCGKLSEEAYCEVHRIKKENADKTKRIVYDKQRGSRHERGYTNKWIAYSKQYRSDNPLCVICEKKGILKLNDCVDHIIPVSGPDDPLFWDENNHQGLCINCHSEKTAREDGGFGNVKIRGV